MIVARVEIVAEIANAHQGSADEAFALAKAAAKTGAHAIKFQVYTADELLVRAHPRYDHFRRQAFSPDTWIKLLGEAQGLGVPVYCDVFGIDSLALVNRCKVSGVKIHSSDIGNDVLTRAMANAFSIIHVGVGGATAREIDHVLGVIHSVAPNTKPVLLHGFQSYPTAVADACLTRISWLRENFGHLATVGYMDHCDGDTFFAMALPLMAVSQGARVIEKHITLDRSKRGVDFYSSLNPDEFSRFVGLVREAESSLGTRADLPSSAELEYRQTARKQWVAVRPIKAGEVLDASMIVAKRIADAGRQPLPLEKILGRRSSGPIAQDAPIVRSQLCTKSWALVVARSASKRLAAKALLPVGGVPTIGTSLAPSDAGKVLDRTVLCTTELPEDDAIADIGKRLDIPVVRGADLNVLERMCTALGGAEVDLALRITGDDILVDPASIDSSIAYHLDTHCEYSALKDVPSGFDFEIFDADLLRELYARATDSTGTEYLTKYITDQQHQFSTSRIPVPEPEKRSWRLTLDTIEDYRLITTIVDEMTRQGKGFTYSVSDVVAFVEANPAVLKALEAHQGLPHTIPPLTTSLRWCSVDCP